MSKNAVILLLFFIVVTIFLEPVITSGRTAVDSTQTSYFKEEPADKYLLMAGAYLLANNTIVSLKPAKKEPARLEKRFIKTVLTAYTSSPEETDDTPFITASGTYTRHGVAASNFLPFGTRIRVPKIFGGQIFVIEDRLHERYNDRIDIWFSEKENALNFGLRVSEIEIL